ncbi:anhydro-N-acetylmuramic acid kinase [Psychromonas sp. CNPT3]|uniref:anhydro-N-acetylmuramic acid kinase n=1 Tax=Psychromonas sp. CNPT3 TaxID=314282 RepID=UPI00006E5076|nr:anhydro-N-acetylmuramic acid kinase [Psychromonas sp. CNPT3]AGH82429.1 anhydro-N-acetylmuramic acid kinase [Psychromonas sp. CNPT3]
MNKYYIGLMSGTSLDALDIVIAERSPAGFKQVAQDAVPLPASMRQNILRICEDKTVDLQTLGEVDHQFALLCADAINSLLATSKLLATQICAIGSHGQTVFHSPLGAYPFTQQIGDANLIAAKTGIPCVSDFRRMDMAYGGQGAPLVPAFHQALFADSQAPRIILNIGGIANISILDAQKSSLGYDTGPGNILMDAWINRCKNKTFDKDALFALQGHVLPDLLAKLSADPYFTLAAPKSTGREKFNVAWLIDIIAKNIYRDEDVQRTLCELTVLSISEEILKEGAHADIFVCGGGALNPLLMQRLSEILNTQKIQTTHALGVDPMYVEGMAFAWLAEQRMLEKHIELHCVTGARQDAILGCVYLA